MLPSLLPHASVITIDCRGHGGSTKSPGPYSVEQFADDVADLLTHIGWDRAAIAGASMGGCIALAFAGRHPMRLSGLGLIDTTAGYGEAMKSAWEERGQKALAQGMGSMIDFQLSRWVTPEFRDAMPPSLQQAVATFTANAPEDFIEICRMLGNADCNATLAGIAVPTSIIVGEEDYATPLAAAQNLATHIPGAKLHILPKMRHFTVLECPALVADKLTEILA
jgi:3-oxoadipate enol-lactonase